MKEYESYLDAKALSAHKQGDSRATLKIRNRCAYCPTVMDKVYPKKCPVCNFSACRECRAAHLKREQEREQKLVDAGKITIEQAVHLGIKQ